MNNQIFIKKLYEVVSNKIDNKPFSLCEILNEEISQENINYLNDFIKEGSFFLKQINKDLYIKTYRIEEACIRTIKELEKENYNSYILSILKKEPTILHEELKRWFDTKHSSMLSYVLDKYWHNFILYSKEYERWCIDNYGYMMYHTPKFAYENKIITNEEIILDVMGYFKIYSQNHDLDERILLYNFPFLLFKKEKKIFEIKEILEDLIS